MAHEFAHLWEADNAKADALAMISWPKSPLLPVRQSSST